MHIVSRARGLTMQIYTMATADVISFFLSVHDLLAFVHLYMSLYLHSGRITVLSFIQQVTLAAQHIFISGPRCFLQN